MQYWRPTLATLTVGVGLQVLARTYYTMATVLNEVAVLYDTVYCEVDWSLCYADACTSCNEVPASVLTDRLGLLTPYSY